MPPRAFQSGNPFDLPRDGDRERLRIRDDVGEGRTNRPDDVITVERLLRAPATSAFAPGLSPPATSAPPRAMPSVGRNGATGPDTARIAPDDAMLDVLADEAAERERNDRCRQLQVDLANLQIEIDERSAQVEQASADLALITEEAENLNQRHDLQLVIAVIAQAVPAGWLPLPMKRVRSGTGLPQQSKFSN